jgi:hypothetical protein
MNGLSRMESPYRDGLRSTAKRLFRMSRQTIGRWTVLVTLIVVTTSQEYR